MPVATSTLVQDCKRLHLLGPFFASASLSEEEESSDASSSDVVAFFSSSSLSDAPAQKRDACRCVKLHSLSI